MSNHHLLFFLRQFETYEQVHCDTQFDMMQCEGNTEPREEQTNGCLALIRSLNEELGVPLSCTSFEVC